MRWSLRSLAELGRSEVARRGGSERLSALWEPDPSPQLFSLGCFEVRLDRGAHVVDFSACVSAQGKDRLILNETLSAPGSRDQWPPGLGWTRCLDLLTEWSEPGSVLNRASNCVWWEFDLETGLDPQPFGIVRLRHPDEPQADGVHPIDAVQRSIGLLGGQTPEPETRELLRECHAALPPSGRFLHVAVMPLRRQDAFRLIVSVPIHAVAEYVKKLPFPLGSTISRDVELVSTRLRDFPAATSVHLDFSDAMEPRVGIDLYRPDSALENAAWRSLLDFLSSDTDMDPEKAWILVNWPMTSGERHRPSPFGMDREIAVKIVISPGRDIEAKTYLAFGPRIQSQGCSDDADCEQIWTPT